MSVRPDYEGMRSGPEWEALSTEEKQIAGQRLFEMANSAHDGEFYVVSLDRDSDEVGLSSDMSDVELVVSAKAVSFAYAPKAQKVLSAADLQIGDIVRVGV